MPKLNNKGRNSEGHSTEVALAKRAKAGEVETYLPPGKRPLGQDKVASKAGVSSALGGLIEAQKVYRSPALLCRNVLRVARDLLEAVSQLEAFKDKLIYDSRDAIIKAFSALAKFQGESEELRCFFERPLASYFMKNINKKFRDNLDRITAEFKLELPQYTLGKCGQLGPLARVLGCQFELVGQNASCAVDEADSAILSALEVSEQVGRLLEELNQDSQEPPSFGAGGGGLFGSATPPPPPPPPRDDGAIPPPGVVA